MLQNTNPALYKEKTHATTPVFYKHIPAVGDFYLRPLRIPEDISLVHSWVTQPYAKYWKMVGFSPEEVESGYREICQTADVHLGYFNDKPAFLLETYSPLEDPVGEHYNVLPGDLGMHVLVAPPDEPIRGFTWSVFKFIMDYMFRDPEIKRIVVEPDIRNEKIHALNIRAGFEYQRVIQLGPKTAHLAFCTREQYYSAEREEASLIRDKEAQAPEKVAHHLQPEIWQRVNRHLIRKALSEFAHERLIQPVSKFEKEGWTHFELATGQANIKYHFRARVLNLEHWHIDPQSIEKRLDGQKAELDAVRFVIENRDCLGIPAQLLPTYLEEIASTLYGAAFKHANPRPTSEELTRSDFQVVESSMMEGHPVFLANNGRIGFDAMDYLAYAPETGSRVKLIWIAAHKSKSLFVFSEDLHYSELMEQELGSSTIKEFNSRLKEQGLNPEDYFFLPVHPWQWFNKLVIVFSPDLATRNLVCLGYGEDDYQAQQSIRTFFNVSQPQKRYVKTALSILNMGFMRGLSPNYMSHTPAINDWIHNLIDQDPFLTGKGFCILREIAAVGYHNDYFEAVTEKDSPYRKMLAALWRESPIPQLKPDQRLMTMASLLHVDANGQALVPRLIRSSGLKTEDWLHHYLDCYFSPLLHCFYAHDLVFMPHGENLILVLEKNVPIRAIMKDIAEESAIMNTEVVLSEKVQRLSVDVPEHLKILSIFTDVFDCFFRYLSAILLEHSDFPETAFWNQVADCVLQYQNAHPELADKFERYDLFAPEFTRSCVNRLQLGNNQQMIDLANPAKNLKFEGTLKNPIAAFKSHPENMSPAGRSE